MSWVYWLELLCNGGGGVELAHNWLPQVSRIQLYKTDYPIFDSAQQRKTNMAHFECGGETEDSPVGS
ncbi:hypothetical protein ABIA60_004145 [Pseudomonas frederiksbergensis]